jgi:hypothetical protein
MTKWEGEAVPSRKALALLREAPDKLELLLRWCSEKDAARAVVSESAESVRSLVARLGTLDRHHYLESVKRLASDVQEPELPGVEPPPGTGDADLADCELPELVTRFRHFRAQSSAFLETLPEGAWEREGFDPVLRPVSLSCIVTHWVKHDACALASLSATCAELHPS